MLTTDEIATYATVKKLKGARELQVSSYKNDSFEGLYFIHYLNGII